MTHQLNDELKPNYCFWCGAGGLDNFPSCLNCGNEIGSYPPEVAHLLTNQRNQLLDELLGEMPQDRPQATKQDELIPFDGDKKVEMHWLRKCQDAGFNQCRSQVIEIINAKKSKEME